jgi:hypothetical protein
MIQSITPGAVGPSKNLWSLVMIKRKGVVELVADLKRLSNSFRSLIAYKGDDEIRHWYRLRALGDTILNDIWLETHSSPRSAFDAIEGFRNQDLSAWPASSCDHNRLFKKLVGFEFEPRYRSFMARTPLAFEDGSRLTRELCFSPGLIFQTVIAVDPELANDLERLWPIHRFELLDRCANGCEMLIEMIEREMAEQKPIQQADDGEDGKRVKKGRVSANTKMIEYAQNHPEATGYSAEKWRQVIGVGSKSTIAGTAFWKNLRKFKEISRAELLERQSNAASDESNAPGKPKKIKPKDLQ